MSPLRGWVWFIGSLFVYNYLTPSGLGWFIGSFIIRLQLCHPFGVGLVHWFIHYSSTIMSPLRGWFGWFIGSLFVYNYITPSGLGWFIGSLFVYNYITPSGLGWFIGSLFVYNYVTPSGLGWVHWIIIRL